MIFSVITGDFIDRVERFSSDRGELALIGEFTNKKYITFEKREVTTKITKKKLSIREDLTSHLLI